MGRVLPVHRIEDCVLTSEDRHGTLRQRAERRLFELEAMAELMAAELGEETVQSRLLACRWAAARALFLDVLEIYQPKPSNWEPIGHPWSPLEERGLVGRLCQRHNWRTFRGGLLAKREGGGRG
jgi:hypothetical protein